MQSLARLHRVDLGFNPDQLLTMSLELPPRTAARAPALRATRVDPLAALKTE